MSIPSREVNFFATEGDLTPQPVKGLGVLVREWGKKVSVEELTFLPPGDGEVRVKVHACGLCHSDLSQLSGKFPVPPPTVLGHEGAGVIEAVGPNIVGKWKIGDRVILTLLMPCSRCDVCAAGRPSLCANRPRPGARIEDASGKSVPPMAALGCMADYAVVTEEALVAASDDMPLDRGALVSCGVTTGTGAVICKAKVHLGSSCCVIGCGGVGLNAIQGCRIAGARQIIAVDTLPSKLEAAKRFGATHTVNAKEVKSVEKEVRRLTGGAGTDYSFEVIGMPETARQASAVIKPGGTAVLVGVADFKDSAPVNQNAMVLGERTVTGSFMGSIIPRTFVPMMCDLYKKGDLMLDELVSRRYHLTDAQEAFDALVAGENLRGVFVMHDLKDLATPKQANL